MSAAGEVCRAFRNTGRCRYGDACKFEHTEGDTIEPPPRGPCFDFRDAGNCKYGDKCRFLHGDDDVRPATTPAVRTRAPRAPRADAEVRAPKPRGVCYDFRDAGDCKFGDKCRFAHGEDDARPATEAPARRAPGLCFNFRDTGNCEYGDECRFSHAV